MDVLVALENDPSAILLAGIFGAAGSFLAVDFMARARDGNSVSRLNWLFIVSVIFGAASWSAQVLTVLSHRAGFDPAGLFSSLLAFTAITTLGFYLALRSGRGLTAEAGGAVIGIGGIVGYNIVLAAAGHPLPHETAGAGAMAAYLATIGLCALGFSSAVRLNGRFSRLFAAGMLMASFAPLAMMGMPDAPEAAALATAGRDIVLPSVIVIMTAVLGTALATYNIENQSRHEAIRTLRNFSVTDSLTGLSNRSALKAHVGSLIETTDRGTTQFAVLAFNINRFRLVNDVHGSEAGDMILKTVAARLVAALSPCEFVARVSADEFYAVKSGIHRKADAVAFAAKMLEIVREPIMWKGAKLDVTARIGGAMFPNSSDLVEELLGQADIAMCRAQALNSDDVVFFDPAVDKAKRDLNALSIDLRKAIDDREFELYFQPQHCARTQSLVGFEALIRWNHPLRGMVSPVDFIPLAEKTGMINEIGAWVIREACIAAAGWTPAVKVAVNVSANQIMRNDLPEIVSDALARSGLDPRRLELEITESGIVNDERHAISILNRLKGLGCSVAMDDFGTGFSSLSTFKKFPFDKIKIDRAFISDIATNKQSYAIVNAAVGVGRPLGIMVLAEGVEDEEQLSLLNQLGCDEVQGYFFGRPVPAGEARSLLRTARTAVGTSADDISNIVSVSFRKA